MYDFGKHWSDYSRELLDETRVETARNSLIDLVGENRFKGRSFLDVGCGTGMFSIGASLLGAGPVLGIDVNAKCIETAENNTKKYISGTETPKFLHLSILDRDGVGKLGKYDIVYAWGSLHYTEQLRNAVGITADLVAPNGVLVLAIYNKHFTSPIWRRIKWLYAISPAFVQIAMYYLFVPVIFLAKLATTGENPLKKKRAMDFFVDVKGWIGGWPYEYASAEEVTELVTGLGFRLEKLIRGNTPIACNQFVFEKR